MTIDKTVRVCPECNGKGHSFNRMSLMLTVGLPIAWLCDADILKKMCERCSGRGVVRLVQYDL